MKNPFKKSISALFLVFVLASGSLVVAQSLEQQVDALLSAQYPADQPGVTALVAKDGKVVYRKAFGMANLELGIPMKPENVLEIGSITKQFTAVAILMLEEQGKLSVTDPITTYFPDYPTQGTVITVHQLLNHTSGIRSYTGMSDFQSQARVDMDPLTLIDVFKNEPMDFKPGERWLYNNSGYIILGAIIEQVSGMSYAEYIQKNIFDPLGMSNSYYGSKSNIIPNRASGYQPTESGYRNADYLSMTLPYAAGSLMSTVDDMLIWQNALNSNTLIPRARLEKAFVNTTLNDGSKTNYGYGWSIDEVNGVPSIEHGGGIFGYTTYGLHIPSENVYVAVLHNGNGNSPTDAAVQIAAIAINKAYPTAATINLNETQMQQWVGAYEFPEGVVRFITINNGSLYSQREGSTALKLNPTSENEFFFDGSFTKYIFKEEGGKRVAYFEDRINKATGHEIDRNLPEQESFSEVTLPTEVLANYVGDYEIQPGFQIKIFLEGERLMGQATGQDSFEVFAAGDHKFFLKVVQASMVFSVDQNGVATAMEFTQGGRTAPAKKLD